MFFEKLIGVDVERFDESKARHTVKGISVRENKILLLESKRGDYTFPGGIERDETHHLALQREIIEETGRECLWIGNNIGKIKLRRKDIFDDSKFYELISHYYPIEVSHVISDLKLSKGEKCVGLRPVWVPINEAIAQNKRYLNHGDGVEFWIDQELFVLEYLKDSVKEEKGVEEYGVN